MEAIHYIWQSKKWSDFTWDNSLIADLNTVPLPPYLPVHRFYHGDPLPKSAATCGVLLFLLPASISTSRLS
jgi:hypothetical protein